MKYARTTIVSPDSLGLGVATGEPVAIGEPAGLGAGVTSGSIEPSEGCGVGWSGGTVPSEPLDEQAATRTMDMIVVTRVAWRFIVRAPWQWSSALDRRLRPSQL